MQHSIVSGYSIVGQLNEVFFGKKYVFVSSWSVKYGNVAGGARSSLVGRSQEYRKLVRFIRFCCNCFMCCRRHALRGAGNFVRATTINSTKN